jgi:hypothetical protein
MMVVFCLRQSGTFILYDLCSWRIEPAAERFFTFQLCAVFPRVARKNRTQKIGKYHAAAGEMCGFMMRNNTTA